jgi:diguanylate cyclase (GGDEF)-like protein
MLKAILIQGWLYNLRFDMTDISGKTYPMAGNESERLACLRQLRVLDTGIDPVFEQIVDLAKSIFQVPIVLVSLVDEDRQWFKAWRGIGVREIAREHAFCNYTILSSELHIVEDTHLDQRFRHNVLVTDPPHIRFYAGCPLEMGNGLMAGSLCLIDQVPRVMSDRELDQLRMLGATTASLLNQYRTAGAMRNLSVELAQASQIVEKQRQELRSQKRLLDCASDLAKIGAWEIDCKTGELLWSDGMYALHEVDKNFKPSIISLEQFYPPDEFLRLQEQVALSRKTNGAYVFEGQMITAKGNKKWVRIAGHVELHNGVPVRRFGMKQDITEEKQALDQIKRLAERDPLTGLRNRAQLMARLGEARDRGSPVSLMLLDLDGFKDINDTHGHAAGDECLREIGQRLDAVRARGRMIARIGGDEFAVLLEGEVDRSTLDDIAGQILKLASAPLFFHGASFRCSTSIGIAVHDGGGSFQEADLMSQADLALYSAKAAGRNRHFFFDPLMKAVADWKVESVASISDALAAGQLELHYQRKVSLATGEIAGYEALLRWNSAEGLRGPGTFSPAIEDPTLSLEIGEFVLQTALDQAAAWHNAGHEFVSVAINVGQGQLMNPSFTNRLLTGLADRGLAPQQFQIEITEDVLLQRGADVMKEVCGKLRDADIRVALDDFGTGFASLTHLLDFPLSIIKIDRSFIARLSKKAGATALVKAIVDIGESLGLEVVAEGVETQEQADFLRSIGCGTGQGYLFHRPQPAKDAIPEFDRCSSSVSCG